jgi:hypothetical protein
MSAQARRGKDAAASTEGLDRDAANRQNGSMSSQYVPLTTAINSVQRTVIESTLRDAGIEFVTQEVDSLTALGATTLSRLEFRVPAERLSEAKEALCANGVVCEISERLLKRSLDDVVRPLLSHAGGRDLGKLLYLAEINNKETVRAIFEATSKLAGGRELLEDLFFAMAREGHGRLASLARLLGPAAEPSFIERLRREAAGGELEARLELIEVLPEFAGRPGLLATLAEALLDDDLEIREAAAEALFALKGHDCGYDAEAPPEEREAAVRELLEHA